MDAYKKPLIIGIIIYATVLTVLGITHGLPNTFPADENGIIKTTLRLPIDNFNPHLYYHPALTFYIYLIPFGLFYLLHSLINFDFSPLSFALMFFKTPHVFFLIGRLTAALIFCGSIYFCYRCLQKVCSSVAIQLGLTLLFAVNPLLIHNHHFALTDAVYLFTSILVIYCFFSIHERPSRKELIFAGLLCGLSLSSKFNAVTLPFMFVCYLFSIRQSLKKCFIDILVFGIMIATIFIILNPYFFIHFQQALSEVERQSNVLTGTGMQDLFSFIVSTFNMAIKYFNPVICLLILTSFIYGLLQRKNKKIVCLALYMIFCSLLILEHNKYFYPRYFFPLFPPAYILMGFLLNTLHKRHRKTIIIFAVVIALSAIYNSALCIQEDLNLLKKNRLTETYHWVQNNIHSGSLILTDLHKLHLPETPEGLKKRWFLAKKFNTYKIKYYELEYLAAKRDDRKRFNIQYVYKFEGFAANTVKLEEFMQTESAISKRSFEQNPNLLRQHDYLITTLDFKLPMAKYGMLLKTFDGIKVYKIIKKQPGENID